MDTEFERTIIDTILDLLKANNPDSFFKDYLYGDFDQYPNSSLPCISAEPVRTEIRVGSTGTDKILQTIMVRVIYDKRDELGAPSSGTEVVGLRKVQELVEGIDPANGKYDTRTIAGILRKNFTLGVNALNQTMDIEYGVVPRPGGEDTSEVHITFIVENDKIMDNRV